MRAPQQVVLQAILLAAGMLACAEAPRTDRTPDIVAIRPADHSAADSMPRAVAHGGARVLTADGWGPLRIGMSRAEVVTALGDDANPDAVGRPDPESCDEFRPARAPASVLVMIEGGRLTRVSLGRGARDSTASGIRVGDPVARVLAAAGTAAIRTPHKYSSPPAEYITVWTKGPDGPDARGVLYEMGNDARVQHLRGGGPSIAYVEGCL